MASPSPPFTVLALGPFTSRSEPWTAPPVEVDSQSLDPVLEGMEISFSVDIPVKDGPYERVEIPCARLKDFHPDAVAPRLPRVDSAPSAAAPPKPPPTGRDRPSGPGIESLLDMVELPPADRPSEPDSRTRRDAGRGPLSAVFEDETFRTVESAWRGLKLLLDQPGAGDRFRCRIVPVSGEALGETLSHLTLNLVDDLPSVILFDLPLDGSHQGIETMKTLSGLCETLLVPGIGWITPRFFGVDDWAETGKLPFLPHLLQEARFAAWRRLQSAGSAKWFALTGNRFLARYPYGPENPPRTVDFREKNLPWASPVWAAGCLLARSIALTGWPTWVTRWNRIRLGDLPLDPRDRQRPLPTETALSEDRVDQFHRSGLVPLVPLPGKDEVILPGETTVGGSPLSYQLLLSIVTQRILGCRDRLGPDIDPEHLRSALEGELTELWESAGDPGPDGMEIRAEPAGDRYSVSISIDPSRRVLPGGRRVDLEFLW